MALNQATMKYFIALNAVLLLILLAFGVSIILCFPAMWLWNGVMPEMFGMKEIGIWMAWKITFLCTILFRGLPLSKLKDKS